MGQLFAHDYPAFYRELVFTHLARECARAWSPRTGRLAFQRLAWNASTTEPGMRPRSDTS